MPIAQTRANHRLTDYFANDRPAAKKSNSTALERRKEKERALRSGVDSGLRYEDEAVVAGKAFEKGDFVVEYCGELIGLEEAEKRVEKYSMEPNGCNMLYFKHRKKQYCIDATKESNRLGRMINHSPNGNVTTKTLTLDGRPRLMLVANKPIRIGEEILHDYGNQQPKRGRTGFMKRASGGNHKLTEYFPIRRSARKTQTTVLEEKQRSIEKALRNNSEEGLKVLSFEGKGRGVVADKAFEKGDFVVEYAGELIDLAEAKKREEKYSKDPNTGCYMYYFKHNNLQYCIDATPESDRLGRLVNHSRNGNLSTKTVFFENSPRLILVAKEDIKIGEELLYDYGDRSKDALRNYPWLAN